MVNLKKLIGILTKLDQYLNNLLKLAGLDRGDFLADFTKTGSAKYYLQIAVESCIDAAHHIIVSERFRAPENYYESFVILNEEGIIPDEFLPTLRQMVRFRNRLVHLYWEVDDETIYDVLQTNLNDFETFVQHVLTFVERNEPPRDDKND